MTGDWRPLFELGVTAYYRGDLSAGRLACEQLLSHEDLPAEVRERGRRNQTFYTQPLSALMPSVTFHPLSCQVPEPWSRFNPSIATAGDGFAAIVRSANYSIAQGRYAIHDPDGVIRTRNYRLSLAPDLGIRDCRAIDDGPDWGPTYPFPVKGFEDCRLFSYQGAWWTTATTRDRNAAGICQIALLRIDGEAFTDLQILASPDLLRHEKNWVPLVTPDGLFFVYSFRPTVVLKYVEGSGRLQEVQHAPGPAIAEPFRGGSQVIAVNDGYLCIVHESVVHDDGSRVYPHRFVRLDRSFTVTHVSPQFFFLERTVEFCAGLAVHGEQLTASFGFEDREAYVASLPLAEAIGSLRAIDTLREGVSRARQPAT